MAIIRIPILGPGTVPDNSGNVFMDTFDSHDLNNKWKRMIFVFNDTATKLGLSGGFSVPKNYVSGANIVVVWTSATTSGNVVWNFDYRSVGGNDTESLDQSTDQENVSVTDAAPSATYERLESSVALTDTNLAVDDEVEFILSRDGASASDTMSGTVLLFSLHFEYSDA